MTSVPRSVVLAAYAALLVTAAIVFIPPLTAWPVSDAWALFERAKVQELGSIPVPTSTTWYRPLADLVMWVGWRLVGPDPVPYRLLALACHLVTSVLVGRVVLGLTGLGWAAWLAGLTFVFNPHAHEPLWDIADLHTVLAAPVIVAAVLAHIAGKRWAVGVTVIALLVDESGLLVPPLVTLHALVIGPRRGRQLLVQWLAAAAYTALRLGVGLYNEVPQRCSDLRCWASGIPEYANRLFVRPDSLLELVWDWRVPMALGVVAILVVVALVLRPWRPSVLFAAGWLVGTSAYFWLALYPYIADRFLYIPDTGLAVLVGTIASSVVWTRRTALAGGLVVAWLLAGVPMLAWRGSQWISAGIEARAIVQGVLAAEPDPPPGHMFVLAAPHSHEPVIPPGNTGAYVFHNGLNSALRLAYGRADLDARAVR